jgi:DNA-binding IclR family transcriptional regulator
VELARIREQRYAISHDEEEEGLSGIATAIHGRTDELLGVLAVGGPTQRLDRQRGRDAIDELLRAGAEIESVLRRGREPAARLEVIGRAGSYFAPKK